MKNMVHPFEAYFLINIDEIKPESKQNTLNLRCCHFTSARLLTRGLAGKDTTEFILALSGAVTMLTGRP
jgi:hypothetical protein